MQMSHTADRKTAIGFFSDMPQGRSIQADMLQEQLS